MRVLQSSTNSASSGAVLMFWRARTQLPSESSFCTDLHFLVVILKSDGKRSFSAPPSCQWSCQNLLFAPSPKVMLVDARKRAMSAGVHGSRAPVHGRDASVQANQAHRSRKALPNLSRSVTPRPPKLCGLHTVCQFTKGWLVVPGAALPFIQMKWRLILSILFSTHFGKTKIVR